MRKPDIEELRAMLRLRNEKDFQVFTSWAQNSLAEIDIKLRKASGEHLYRLQGQAQCLESIIQRIETAHEVAQKLSK